MIKAAFFDIDGTLVSFRTHRMPASSVEALARMRSRGIRIAVATGRPRYQLDSCVGSDFDACVTLNGQLCFDDAGVFRSAPIGRDDVEVIVGQVLAGRYDAIALLGDRGFANRRSPLVRAMSEQVGVDYAAEDFRSALAAPVYQFCAFVEPGEEGTILSATRGVAQTRWTELFCDVVPHDGGKAAGIAATLERMGIAPAEAVAFGDGGNDLDMFDAVGASVAMGNACEAVKERADFVAPDIDDDGLFEASRRLGLI